MSNCERSNNGNDDDVLEDTGDNEELSEEDKMFGKAASNNQYERDCASVEVDVAVLEACLHSIMNNLDLFWKRSEEYPVECLAEGKSLQIYSCVD